MQRWRKYFQFHNEITMERISDGFLVDRGTIGDSLRQLTDQKLSDE